MKYMVLLYNSDEMHIAIETDDIKEAELVYENIMLIDKEVSSYKNMAMELHYYPDDEIYDVVLQRKEWK